MLGLSGHKHAILCKVSLVFGRQMASPAFVYAFDNLGPERFVELCGLLLGSRYKGFLLSSPGPDGGVDAENCPILGDLVTESSLVIDGQILDSSSRVVFQFKHKVAARVGQANARTKLLSMYRTSTRKSSEVLGPEIAERNPDVYVLVTNVEINPVFRTTFAQICRGENPQIQSYHVLGLDELENWITQDRNLRTLWFPTIFSPARFNLTLKLAQGYICKPVSSIGEAIVFGLDRPVLCLTIMNTGEATSYLCNVKFKIICDGAIEYLLPAPVPPNQVDPMANPRLGEPVEPGRNIRLRYPFLMLQRIAEERGDIFFASVMVWDQIDNLYELDVDEKIRDLLFGSNALLDHG
jgi:hypothetical protein